MTIEMLKNQLQQLAEPTCDGQTCQVVNTMLEALDIEADWTEAELQSMSYHIEELAESLAATQANRH